MLLAARHPDAVGDLLYGAGDLLRPAELDADVDAGDGLSAGGICPLTSLFTFGGTAGILLAGWMMDRWEAHRVVAGGFMLTMALILLLGMEHNHIALFGGLIFLMGIAMNGARNQGCKLWPPPSTQQNAARRVSRGCRNWPFWWRGGYHDQRAASPCSGRQTVY